DGVFQNVLGRGGTSSFFDDPVALAMDAEGILYVLDSKRREVLMFSADGRILNELGKNDLGEYIMEEPVDVAVTVQEV
ncbi:MAG: hypothetical protein GWM98_14235, partial [Nitrospinaceae bacterium]|nr:hypothetical protein [Nitrospinaceae bacterium]